MSDQEQKQQSSPHPAEAENKTELSDEELNTVSGGISITKQTDGTSPK